MELRQFLVMLAVPPLTVACYWLLISARSATLDLVAVSVATALGIAGIWMFRGRSWEKLVITAVYVPFMGLALTASLLMFECVTGNCL